MSIQEILKLPASDRLLMVEKIWESLDPTDIKISQSHKIELDRRIELDKSGKMPWHSVEEVKTALYNRK